MKHLLVPTIPFVQAKRYKTGGNSGQTRIVIHSAECNEAPGAAMAVARYFQKVTRPASAHYVVDDKSVVQCVRDGDTAYHAPPNTGPRPKHGGSIGIELCGRANQRAADWHDTYSRDELHLCASLTADLCVQYSIPPQYVSSLSLKNGVHGITTHACISAAWGETDHYDPGPNFPMDEFIADVNKFLNGDHAVTEEIKMVPPDHAPWGSITGIVSSCDWPHGGALAVNEAGAVFTFGSAPYKGGANQPYFANMKAGSIKYRADQEVPGYGEGYTIFTQQVNPQTGKPYEYRFDDRPND